VLGITETVGIQARHNGWTSRSRRAWIILEGCSYPFTTEPHTGGLVQ